MFLRSLLSRPTTARPMHVIQRPAIRGFSSGQMKPPSSGFGMGPALGLGLGIAGFGYLAYTVGDMNRNKMRYMAEGQTFMSPLVQSRLGKTFGWFSFGITSTVACVYACRNTMAWAALPWWAFMGGTFACMMGAHAFDYETQLPLKIASYTAMTGLMGLTIVPLVQAFGIATAADAALATGLSMGTLGGIAYNAPSEQFLNWGGMLGIACTGMLFVSIASIMNPASRALHNVWLWGGLGLTGCLTMYHTQEIIHRAKTEQMFDPLGNSIGIYMNAINFFIRMMLIMGGNRKK